MNPAKALGDKNASLVLFTLETACNEAEGFEEASKEIYDAIRKLGRDIETHEKKKKVLDLQIERTKQAYSEYVESIEILESSVIFLRLLDLRDTEVKNDSRPDPGTNKEEKRRNTEKKHIKEKPTKKYSRLLKTHNLLSLPSFSSQSHLARETLGSIKKATVAYKTIKQCTDALAIGEKEAGQPRKHMSEIESRFDLYEKRLNCKYAKMSYAAFVNTLSLQLMQGIFQEVSDVLGLSEKHRELLNDSAELVRVQLKDPNNPFNEGICSELEDLKATSQSELERMKRKISNELRPSQHKEDEVTHLSRITRRKIPLKSGFILSAFPSSPCLQTMLLTFRVYQHIRRGRIYLFKNLIYIQELIFGWEFTVQKENIYYIKSTGPNQLEMRALDAPDIIFFSPNDSIASLKSWAIGQYNDALEYPKGYSDTTKDSNNNSRNSNTKNSRNSSNSNNTSNTKNTTVEHAKNYLTNPSSIPNTTNTINTTNTNITTVEHSRSHLTNPNTTNSNPNTNPNNSNTNPMHSLGVVSGTLGSVYTALFSEEIDGVLSPPDTNQETDQKKPGWSKSVTVSRKSSKCSGRESSLGCIAYSETSILDYSDPEEIVVLIRAKISIIRGFLLIPAVAQIHIRVDSGSACSVWVRGEERDLMSFSLFSFSSRVLLSPFIIASYVLDRLKYFSSMYIIRRIYSQHIQSLHHPNQQDRKVSGKLKYALYATCFVIFTAILLGFQGYNWNTYTGS